MRNINEERARERMSRSFEVSTPSIRSAIRVAEIKSNASAAAFEITTWNNRPPDDADGSAPVLAV